MNPGKIKISRTFISNPGAYENELSQLFSKFIPVYIENDPLNDHIIYSGYSKLFDTHIEGNPTPFYEPVIGYLRNEEGNVCASGIQFKKI